MDKRLIPETWKKISTKGVAFFALEVCSALLVLIIWMNVVTDVDFAHLRGLTVFLTSLPLALFIAQAIAVLSAKDKLEKEGIHVRSTAVLEKAADTRIIVIEKSGTITKGEPIVTDIFPTQALTSSGYSLLNNMEDELVKVAGIIESKSDHPFAKAIDQYIRELHPYEEDEDEDLEITDVQAFPGAGVLAKLGDQSICGGNYEFVSKHVYIHDELRAKAESLSSLGKTPFFYAIGKRLLGIIAVSDTLRDDAKDAVNELKNMGIHVIMLSGDNENTTEAIGRVVGTDEIVAKVLSSEKEAVIKKLRTHGFLTLVGSKTTDTAAYKAADLSMVIGGIDDNADEDYLITTEDVEASKDSLKDAVAVIRLSSGIKRRNKLYNILYAVYFLITMPFAAGLIKVYRDYTMGPVVGAVIMLAFGIALIVNARAFGSADIYDASKDRKIKNPITDSIVHGIIEADSEK